MELAYWSIVFLGGVTLVAEAYRQFTTPVSINHFGDHFPILKGVEIEALCTNSELIRGFLAYSSLYLVVYGVILGSAEITEIIVSADKVQKESGSVLSNPLIISASIITALSFGIFSPLEKKLRALAHIISGIPRGVYRVINKLSRYEFSKYCKNIDTPILDSFLELANKYELEVKDKSAYAHIVGALRVVDALHPAILGTHREQIFIAPLSPTMDQIFSKHDQGLSELKLSIKALDDDTGVEEFDIDQLEKLYRQIQVLKRNSFAIFSLLYIKNQKEVIIDPKSPMSRWAGSKVVSFLQDGSDSALDALAGSVFIMILATLFIHPLLLIVTNPILWADDPHYLIVAARNETLLAVLYNSLLFLGCASVAILTREASIEWGTWKKWGFKSIPFGQLLWHSLIPGLIAILIVILIKLVEFGITVETMGDFEEFVISNWRFCLMNFPTGVFISLIVFIAQDQISQYDTYRVAVLSAIFCAFFYLIWAVFVQTLFLNPTTISEVLWRIREILFLAIPAFLFSISFTLILKKANEEE